jgi:hypothetical protein
MGGKIKHQKNAVISNSYGYRHPAVFLKIRQQKTPEHKTCCDADIGKMNYVMSIFVKNGQ